MNEPAPVRAGDALDWLHEQGKRRSEAVPEFDVEETLRQVRATGQHHSDIEETLRKVRATGQHHWTEQDRLEIAGRCLPAAGCDAGGDWYDIIPLPGDRTGLIVGDVMGHGPLAATVMTRLSAAAYALADLDLPPAEVVRQLNRTALALPQDTLVTCAYAVIDPARQSCAIAAAGHLPPILALPDGTTRVLDIPAGQSLGVPPPATGRPASGSGREPSSPCTPTAWWKPAPAPSTAASSRCAPPWPARTRTSTPPARNSPPHPGRPAKTTSRSSSRGSRPSPPTEQRPVRVDGCQRRGIRRRLVHARRVARTRHPPEPAAPARPLDERHLPALRRAPPRGQPIADDSV